MIVEFNCLLTSFPSTFSAYTFTECSNQKKEKKKECVTLKHKNNKTNKTHFNKCDGESLCREGQSCMAIETARKQFFF